MLDYVVELVVRETEIPAANILSNSRSREIVDARYMLVKALSLCGFYAHEIAGRLKLSRRTVERIILRYAERKEEAGKMFRILAARISSQLRQ